MEGGPHLVGDGDIQVHDLVLFLRPGINKDYEQIAIVDLVGITADRDHQGQIASLVPTTTNLHVCLSRGDDILHEPSTADEDAHRNKGRVNYDRILLPAMPLMLVALFY